MKQPNLQLCPTCYTMKRFDGDMCVRCCKSEICRMPDCELKDFLHRHQHPNCTYNTKPTFKPHPKQKKILESHKKLKVISPLRFAGKKAFYEVSDIHSRLSERAKRTEEGMTTKSDSTAEILKEFDSVFRKAPIDYYFYDSPFYESECGKKVKIFIAQALQRQRESDMQAFEEIIGPDNPMVGLQTIVAQNELRAELRQKLKGMK